MTRSYNNDFKVTASSINGNWVNYQYDNDGLLTQAGDLSLSRQKDNGLLLQTQLGNFTSQWTYNAFGEVVRETVFSGEQVYYNTVHQRDNLGRITQKTETASGVSTLAKVFRYIIIIFAYQNFTYSNNY